MGIKTGPVSEGPGEFQRSMPFLCKIVSFLQILSTLCGALWCNQAISCHYLTVVWPPQLSAVTCTHSLMPAAQIDEGLHSSEQKLLVPEEKERRSLTETAVSVRSWWSFLMDYACGEREWKAGGSQLSDWSNWVEETCERTDFLLRARYRPQPSPSGEVK